MAEQDKGYSGPLGIDIAPNGSGILSEHWEQKDIRKILNGEISSTQEDLTHLREYVLQLSMKAHATLTDPDSLAELHTYGYTVTRKDGNLPRTNKHILISPTDSDTFPSLELTHRYAPLSQDQVIDDPEFQDISLSSSSIDFQSPPSGFYLNAVSSEGLYGVFYVGSDSRSNTVMPVLRLPLSESKAEAFYQSIALLQSASESPLELVKTLQNIS